VSFDEQGRPRFLNSWSLDTKRGEFIKELQCPPYIELLRYNNDALSSSSSLLTQVWWV
jgi:hypothetical protein